MPNPFMNIGMMPGGQGQAPLGQSPKPQQGPLGVPQMMAGLTAAPKPGVGGGTGEVRQPDSSQLMANYFQNTPQARSGGFRENIARLEAQLRQARLAGAPPSIIANYEAELAAAREEMRMAGIQEMYNQQMQQLRTGYGAGSVGSRGGGGKPSPYESQARNMNSLDNQLLAALFGIGYGRASGGAPIG